MDILIKGMKMPKSCDECRIMVFEDTNCEAELYCGCPIVFKAHPQGVDHRPDNCPLVPVQPHGRLIDVKSLENMHFTESMYDAESKLFVPFVEVATAIFDAPTILEAEEGET